MPGHIILSMKVWNMILSTRRLGQNLRRCLSLSLLTPIKKTAQNKVVKLYQGNSIAEEFFQQFNILSRLAEYGTDHNHFLINLIKWNIKFSLIKKIYSSSLLPSTLVDYKKCIITLDALERRLTLVNRTSGSRNSAKGSSMPSWRQPVEKTKKVPKQLSALVQTQRDGTGTTFGGCGQLMDIERAHCEGLCFNCGERDHLSCDCLKLQKSTRTYMRWVIDGLLGQDHKDLLAKLGFP